MSIVAGGIGAAIRRNDPYDGWDLAHDYSGQGPGRPGRVYLKRNGVIYPSFKADPLASFARSGADLLTQASDGSWRAYAANEESLLLGTGFDIPEGSTNKCTNYNAVLPAVSPCALADYNATPNGGVTASSGDGASRWGNVDAAASLRAAGWGQLLDTARMNGVVFEVDATSAAVGTVLYFPGPAGNTSTHAISILARTVSGAGSGRIGYLETGLSNVTFPSNWAWVTDVRAPGVSTYRMAVSVSPGSKVQFILNKLEEKAYATNPIIVSGVAATRGTPAGSLAIPGIVGRPLTLVAWANLSALDGVNRDLVTLSDGADANKIAIRRSSSNSLRIITVAGGVVTNTDLALSYTGARAVKAAIRFAEDGSVAASLGGAALQAITGAPAQSLLTTLTPGRGATSTASFLNSPLTFLGVKSPGSDAEVRALAA